MESKINFSVDYLLYTCHVDNKFENDKKTVPSSVETEKKSFPIWRPYLDSVLEDQKIKASQSLKLGRSSIPVLCTNLAYRQSKISSTQLQGDKKKMKPCLVVFGKQKRVRSLFTHEQLRALEQRFQENRYTTANERAVLAMNLGLTINQIKVWFQNRRTKMKRITQEKRANQ